MAPKKPLLERMRENPKGDWTISDVAKLCSNHDIVFHKPSSGSHYQAVSPLLNGHLSVPYKRPIKPYYIKDLVDMIDAHNRAAQTRKEQ